VKKNLVVEEEVKLTNQILSLLYKSWDFSIGVLKMISLVTKNDDEESKKEHFRSCVKMSNDYKGREERKFSILCVGPVTVDADPNKNVFMYHSSSTVTSDCCTLQYLENQKLQL
jgi:hypothetical protein